MVKVVGVRQTASTSDDTNTAATEMMRTMAAANNTKLGRIGNSTGLTLTREILEAAGLERGTEVRVEAEPGRIVVTPAGGVRERSVRLFERSLVRYDRAYARLAK
jgi:antitoxin component of MazEF toxin-antitoxin module